MANPFDLDFIATLDWWGAAQVYQNACLDPEPAKNVTSLDILKKAYEKAQDKELERPAKMRQGWLMY